MLTGHYRARYVKMRELMLDGAGGKSSARQYTSGTLLADKDLLPPSRLSHACRDGWKCKDRAHLFEWSRV
jgi:hypothetical protein